MFNYVKENIEKRILKKKKKKEESGGGEKGGGRGLVYFGIWWRIFIIY